MKRYCYTLDLKNNKNLIKKYIEYHQNVWPEVLESFKKNGVINAEIYNVSNRLFFLIDTINSFSVEKKNKYDLENPIIQKWEKLMWEFQEPLPFRKKNEKWIKMNRIFKL
jgi:L-rhamnose mutarotase